MHINQNNWTLITFSCTGYCLTDVALRQDKCYFLPNITAMTPHHNWTDGRIMCNAENADLLSIEDEKTIYDVHIMFSR